MVSGVVRIGTRILFTGDDGELIQGTVVAPNPNYLFSLPCDICILWETDQRGTYDESFLREDSHFTIEGA